MNYELIGDNFLEGIDRIFYNRGIDPKDKEHYLHVNADDINSPELLENIAVAVSTLFRHVESKDRVGVVVDCDCDGFTSSALLINYLHKILPEWTVNNLVYYLHEDKQHGLSDMVDKILSSQVKLVLVPDAGGGDGQFAETLAANGIETVIIDHHHTTEESCTPAIVVNNQLGLYPNKTLSGVGVVYKFCEYIDSLLDKDYATYFQDLVAVGCVADLMVLQEYETLYYIRNGLEHVNNPFLRELVTANTYSVEKHGGLNPFTASFYIAPFINGIVRSGTMAEKKLVFESLLEMKGRKMVSSGKRGFGGQEVSRVEEAVRVATNVKNRQNKIKEDSIEKIESLIQEQEVLKNKILAVRLPSEMKLDKNVLGLIANTFVEKYQRPIMLLNETKDKDGNPCWAGSCRDYQYSPIEDFRQFIENLPETQYASGHRQAFGSSILDSKFSQFVAKTNEILANVQFMPTYKVDFILDGMFDPQLIFDIAALDNYWGKGFEKPYLAIQSLRVDKDSVQLLSRDKKPTLKITLPNGVSLIKFKATEEEFEKLSLDNKTCVIDVVGTCMINYFNGNRYPQLEIVDYDIVSTHYNF